MSDEDFIDRWSRRKRAAAREEAGTDAEPAPPVPGSPAETPTGAAPPITEEELAALPRIEDLTEGSDIRAFLRPGVPAAMKNSVLRKMWMLTPAIRDHKDVAVDYAWDWNSPGGVPGGGGRISAESLRKMVDALGGRREPEKPGEDRSCAPSGSGKTAALPPASGAPPGPSEAAGEAPSLAQGEAPAERPATPQRRHGGAVPNAEPT